MPTRGCTLSAPSARPVQDPQRAERVPAAGLALAVFHLEVDLALVDVLERPAAVRAPFLLYYFDRLGDPIVGLGLSSAEVFEAAQDVVEVVRRERGIEPTWPALPARRDVAAHPDDGQAPLLPA